MAEELEIKVETTDCFTCLSIAGELDTGTAPQVDQAIQSCLSEGTKNLMIDLTETEYVSSMGLRVFLSVLKIIKASGGRMVLAGLNDEVQEILDMAGFTPLFDIAVSAGEARTSLSS